MSNSPESAIFKVIVVLLVVFALALFAPFWAWIILGLWFGMFGQRLLVPIAKFLRGRERAASVLTVGLLVVIIAPIAFVVIALASDAAGLVKKLLESGDAKNMAESLVSSGDEEPSLVSIVKTAGPKAWGILTLVAGEATKVLIGFLIFLTVAYSALASGPGAYAWCERHVPIDPRYIKRFTDAFRETGRGLFIGIGGSCLVQSIVAGAMYLILGVPRALVLALLTLIASLVPAIGTAVVWIPVAIGLAVTGKTTSAIILAAVGILVISSIDNLVRPMLARYGKLSLPSAIVLISMFGGLLLFGGWGLILGPLVARLAKEALVLFKEERDRALPNT